MNSRFPNLIREINARGINDPHFYEWTAEKAANRLSIALPRMRKIWSGERNPTFAEGLALLNLLCGERKRPKVRDIWPKLSKNIPAENFQPQFA